MSQKRKVQEEEERETVSEEKKQGEGKKEQKSKSPQKKFRPFDKERGKKESTDEKKKKGIVPVKSELEVLSFTFSKEPVATPEPMTAMDFLLSRRTGNDRLPNSPVLPDLPTSVRLIDFLYFVTLNLFIHYLYLV